jgi:ribosome-associated protein
MREVGVRPPDIPLQALLKLAGLVETGGQAKQLIQAGVVRVNGAPELRRGRKLRPGDRVEVAGREPLLVVAAGR